MKKIFMLSALIMFTAGSSHASWTYTGPIPGNGEITDGSWTLSVSVANDGISVTTRNNPCVVAGSGVLDLSTPITGPLGEILQLVSIHSGNTVSGPFFGTLVDVSDIYFPDSLTSIGDYAFNSNTNIKAVHLSENLQTIGQGAFEFCSALTNVVPLLPASVININRYMFKDTSVMGKLVLSNPELEVIGELAFYNVTNIVSADMSGSGIISIANQAFQNCSSLGDVFFPETLESVGQAAFEACSSLTNIVPFLPASVTTISAYIFKDTSVMGELVLSNPELKAIGAFAFLNATNIVSVDMSGSGITSIGEAAFRGCADLSVLSLPPELSSISNYAFTECRNLNSVFLPDTLATIGVASFENCSSLTNVVPLLSASVTTIGEYAFNLSPVWGKLVLSNPELKSIGPHTFNGANIVSADMSDSGITSIGNQAFQNCKEISSVYLSSVLESVGVAAFENCDRLTNISPFLPATVTTIGGYAFKNSPIANSLVLKSPLPVFIGQEAFCANKMDSIYFGEGVTSLSYNDIFQNATTVTQVWFCGDVPAFAGNPFSGWTDFQARVYVPRGNESWDEYKETPATLFDILSPEEEETFMETYPGERLPAGKFWLIGSNSAYRQWYCLWNSGSELRRSVIIVK